jgi:ubiquitin C-terminal hydrolase
MGESGSSGHFIATCKSPIDGLWYQYNDDLVFRVDDFNNQILNYAMPYILFYQKRT